MFERYSQRARRTIYYAKHEALNRFSHEIEPRDIVLGLSRDAHQPDCPFAKLHENADELRALVDPKLPLYGPPANWDIPLSNEGKMALTFAAEECDQDGRYTLGSHHLLRGVLRTGGEMAEKLTQAGYSISWARQASEEVNRTTPDAGIFLGWRLGVLRWWIRKYRVRLVVLAALIYVIAELLYVHRRT